MGEHITSPLDAGDVNLRPAKRRAQERLAHGEPLCVEKPSGALPSERKNLLGLTLSRQWAENEVDGALQGGWPSLCR